jgi:hypothetical protein
VRALPNLAPVDEKAGPASRFDDLGDRHGGEAGHQAEQSGGAD